MREKLAKIGSDDRHQYTGTFVRFGQKSGYKGRVEFTVLLSDVKDSDGNIVTDHLWFNLTKGFSQLHLEVGDVVSFCARVEVYRRGYFGYREDVYVPCTYDYKLSRPTHVVLVSRA